MNKKIEDIVHGFSVEELSAIKNLVLEIEKNRSENFRSLSDLETFSSEYFKYLENNFSQSYLKSNKLSFNHLIKFFNKNKLLVDISIREAEEFKGFIMKYAPLGYKVYIRNLKAAFNKAVDWEMVTSNPFAKIKITKHQQVTPKFLTMENLVAVLEKTKSPMISDLFLFAFYSGCRPGEIVKLRRGNIDLTNRLITIGDKNLTTKNRRTRVVPICNELLQTLTCRCQGKSIDDFIFSKSNGFPFNRDYISRAFKRARKAAGLDDDIHLYTLRHSFASNLAAMGAPLITIKDLLGHSSIVTTQIYSHSNLESLKKAINKFN